MDTTGRAGRVCWFLINNTHARTAQEADGMRALGQALSQMLATKWNLDIGSMGKNKFLSFLFVLLMSLWPSLVVVVAVAMFDF